MSEPDRTQRDADRRATRLRTRSTTGSSRICFILLALSGLALFHPSMFWLSDLFGGGTWTRILHPFIGVVMFVAFLPARRCASWRDNRMTRRDWQWLARVRDVVTTARRTCPKSGATTRGQKMLFWVLVLCLPLLLLSGIVIWRAYFAPTSRSSWCASAALVHAISPRSC